jgi:hypothetical protein
MHTAGTTLQAMQYEIYAVSKLPHRVTSCDATVCVTLRMDHHHEMLPKTVPKVGPYSEYQYFHLAERILWLWTLLLPVGGAVANLLWDPLLLSPPKIVVHNA